MNYLKPFFPRESPCFELTTPKAYDAANVNRGLIEDKGPRPDPNVKRSGSILVWHAPAS